ncbi:MAG: hypothetical protein NZM04_05600 [Methylacidiphilales bacterium]|nr:hypothetical protein [Candidatus Methylacidiphilales bacterium]
MIRKSIDQYIQDALDGGKNLSSAEKRDRIVHAFCKYYTESAIATDVHSRLASMLEEKKKGRFTEIEIKTLKENYDDLLDLISSRYIISLKSTNSTKEIWSAKSQMVLEYCALIISRSIINQDDEDSDAGKFMHNIINIVKNIIKMYHDAKGIRNISGRNKSVNIKVMENVVIPLPPQIMYKIMELPTLLRLQEDE